MRVGLVRKWAMVATLAAGVGLIGCKDDGDDDVGGPGGGTGGNPGGSTGGNPGGGGMDSGTDSGSPGGGTGGNTGGGTGGGDAGSDAAATVTCGGQTCTAHVASVLTFAPGCATNFADAEVCGISTAMLGADSGLPPFLEKHAPGVVSASCGAVIDALEPIPDGGVQPGPDGGPPLLGKGNGRIDTNVTVGGSPLQITYPGCCTPAGTCSGHTDMGLLLGASPSEGGFGCMASPYFFRGRPDALAQIKCDPVSGNYIPADGGAGAGDSGAGDAGAGDAGAGDAGAGDGG